MGLGIALGAVTVRVAAWLAPFAGLTHVPAGRCSDVNCKPVRIGKPEHRNNYCVRRFYAISYETDEKKAVFRRLSFCILAETVSAKLSYEECRFFKFTHTSTHMSKV
jgi:hypothetical protein